MKANISKINNLLQHYLGTYVIRHTVWVKQVIRTAMCHTHSKLTYKLLSKAYYRTLSFYGLLNHNNRNFNLYYG